MPESLKVPSKKKIKKIELRVDEDLHAQAEQYAHGYGVSLGALIRALLRQLTDPQNPQPLPPGVEAEKKRPPRRKDGP